MGALYKGICYPSVFVAKQQVCADHNHFWASGTTFYTSRCTQSTFDNVAGGFYATCRQTNGAGTCTNQLVQYPPLLNCNYDGGVNLANYWLGAALLLFVTLFAGKKLIALFSATDRDN